LGKKKESQRLSLIYNGTTPAGLGLHQLRFLESKFHKLKASFHIPVGLSIAICGIIFGLDVFFISGEEDEIRCLLKPVIAVILKP
jgi:hypothetical protein